MNHDHIAALIPQILDGRVFAVAGASRDTSKFGYQVYRSLKAAGYTVYPINPNADTIDGDPVYPLLDNVPEPIDCVVAVTPPAVTEQIVLQAGHLGVSFCWMQPGAESEPAVRDAESHGMRVVHGGPCIMVEIAARQIAEGRAPVVPATCPVKERST